MNSLVVSSHTCSFRTFPHSSSTQSFNLFPNLRQPTFLNFHFFSSKFKPPHFIACCSSGSSPNRSNPSEESILQNDIFHAEVTTPNVPSFASPVSKFSFTDQAFFLIAFIACTVWYWLVFSFHYLVLLWICIQFVCSSQDMFWLWFLQTSVAFTSLVFAAVPTLFVSCLSYCFAFRYMHI